MHGVLIFGWGVTLREIVVSLSYPLAIIGGCPALRRGERPLLGVHGIADMVVSTSALRPVKSIRAVEIDFTTSVCCALHFPGVQVSGVFCLVEE